MREVVPTWTNVVNGKGCKFVAEGGAIEKREQKDIFTSDGEDSYDTGAFSNEAITRKEGGSESQGLKWRAATTGKYYELGLSHEDGGVEGGEKDFGMVCNWGGYLYIYEKGSYVKAPDGSTVFAKYAAGDELEVRVTADAVSYHHNGRLLYTSAKAPTFPLVADCGFCSPGAKAEGVRLRC